MNYFIVTGASKGLGKSIVNLVMEKGDTIFGLSRTINYELVEKAREQEAELHWNTIDLSNTKEIEEVFHAIFEKIDLEKLNSITIINNAGVIEPITTVGNMNSNEIEANVDTNILAPIVITNLFLHMTRHVNAQKTVVNVSSGAANRPISGWSIYCSTKAGLEMFTKTVGLEQEKEKYPTTVISFSPGIMDTNMQSTIRSKSKEQFESIETFKKYKDEGSLRSTDYVGTVLLNLLKSTDIENGRVYDIKQLI